jgi:hypothetical protein
MKLAVTTILVAYSYYISAQGTFENLNFEAAVPAPVC